MMPKHQRVASGPQSRYAADQMPVSLAPTPIYTQRMAMPTANNYYTVQSASAPAPMPLHSQHPTQQPQQAYEQYAASVGPSLAHAPVSHRASSGAWSPQEDTQLLNARMQGLNWNQIKDTYFPNKSPNACRKRHERLMERKGSDDWDKRKLQRLAKEYMGMRREIWSGLAERTGEKWMVVEQKCMSNGLKNLQSAARTASRQERLEAGASFHGYDDDSGISGIGLTPVDELDPSYSSPETSPRGPHSASSGASAGYHHQHHLQPHAHAQLQSLGVSDVPYGMAGYGGGYVGQHGYSSSASSSGSAGHGYPAHGGNSQGSSPYMNGQRLSSVDMGIDAIINRPGGRRGA